MTDDLASLGIDIAQLARMCHKATEEASEAQHASPVGYQLTGPVRLQLATNKLLAAQLAQQHATVVLLAAIWKALPADGPIGEWP